MSKKPPFDPIRFACWLIAGVIGVQCIAVLIGLATCLYYSEIIVKDPNISCDPKDRLTSLLTGALAAALALLAGFVGRPPKE